MNIHGHLLCGTASILYRCLKSAQIFHWMCPNAGRNDPQNACKSHKRSELYKKSWSQMYFIHRHVRWGGRDFPQCLGQTYEVGWSGVTQCLRLTIFRRAAFICLIFCCTVNKQVAQLSQRGRAMLRVCQQLASTVQNVVCINKQLCYRREAARCFVSVSSQLQQYKMQSV